MRVLLLGGTDLTLAIARRLVGSTTPLAGVVHLGTTVPISYSRTGLANVRHADLARWCRERGVPEQAFTDNHALGEFADQSGAEFLLAAGWYHIITAELRRKFPLGAAGLHASLLPQLRGGAPLVWAILSGAEQTGVTLFAPCEGIDEGAIYR